MVSSSPLPAAGHSSHTQDCPWFSLESKRQACPRVPQHTEGGTVGSALTTYLSISLTRWTESLPGCLHRSGEARVRGSCPAQASL